MKSQNSDNWKFVFKTSVSCLSIKIDLIQNVKHRWTSFYNMFERAWELKKIIWKWIKADNNDQFKNFYVQNNEWKKMTNIFSCLQSFSILITLINIIFQVNVHVVFQLFNWLFDEIKKIEKNLKKRKKKRR